MRELIEITKEILANRYPNASVIFLAGSIVRGEGTPFSDLDLVVIFNELPNPYRESFCYRGRPVEAFVHDPETLNYFLHNHDRPSGLPVIAQMVVEGIEVPASSDLSQSLKQLAASLIEMGPPKLSEEEVHSLRYTVTNLVDDIRHPRNKEELVASGTDLYGVLANCYFRTNNLWSAKGKSIPRVLKKANPDLCLQYCDSFDDLFRAGRTEKVIALAEEILKPCGGLLFDGYRSDAPAASRKPIV